MILMASTNIVSTYFDKHKDKVYAGMITANCAGVVIGPILTEYLIKTVTYTYALIVLACINLVVLPAAIVYRGPTSFKHGAQYPGETIISQSEDSGQINSAYSDGEQKVLSGTLSTDGAAGLVAIKSSCIVTETIKEQRETIIDISLTLGPSDSEATLKPSDIEATLRPSDSETSISCTKQRETIRASTRIPKTLRPHVYVWTKPSFVIFLLSFVCISIGENSVYALAVEYSVTIQQVLDLQQAAVGMTLTGVSTVVGAVITTIVCHWKFDKTLYILASSFTMCLSVLLLPVAQTLVGLYILFILFGISEACYVSIVIPWLGHQFDEEGLTIVRASHTYFAMGLGLMFGPVMAGYIGRAVGMHYVFYIVGTVSMIGPALILLQWLKSKNDRACSDDAKSQRSPGDTSLNKTEITL